MLKKILGPEGDIWGPLMALYLEKSYIIGETWPAPNTYSPTSAEADFYTQTLNSKLWNLAISKPLTEWWLKRQTVLSHIARHALYWSSHNRSLHSYFVSAWQSFDSSASFITIILKHPTLPAVFQHLSNPLKLLLRLLCLKLQMLQAHSDCWLCAASCCSGSSGLVV